MRNPWLMHDLASSGRLQRCLCLKEKHGIVLRNYFSLSEVVCGSVANCEVTVPPDLRVRALPRAGWWQLSSQAWAISCHLFCNSTMSRPHLLVEEQLKALGHTADFFRVVSVAELEGQVGGGEGGELLHGLLCWPQSQGICYKLTFEKKDETQTVQMHREHKWERISRMSSSLLGELQCGTNQRTPFWVFTPRPV